MDVCAECRFDYDLTAAEESPAQILVDAVEVAALLQGDDAAVRRRAEPSLWSPLEYGCHLRDVFLVQRERVLAARREDRPEVTAMGRDERAEHDGYAQQHPDDVARQLLDAAALVANALVRLGPADWDRTLRYNYPSPAQRSLRWLALHTAHEARHHRLDVQRQLEGRS